MNLLTIGLAIGNFPDSGNPKQIEFTRYRYSSLSGHISESCNDTSLKATVTVWCWSSATSIFCLYQPLAYRAAMFPPSWHTIVRLPHWGITILSKRRVFNLVTVCGSQCCFLCIHYFSPKHSNTSRFLLLTVNKNFLVKLF